MRIQLPIVLIILAVGAACRAPHSRRLQKNKNAGSLVGQLGTCDGTLLKSFNMFGRTYARPTSLEVCPNVYLSCCTEADQVAIYDNWETDNEEESLNQKFVAYTNTISQFFEQAQEVTEAASRVLTYMERMRNNECKLMARRIVSYQVGDLKRTLLQTFKETYDYMVQAHKGLYCSMCDANTHIYFNSQQKKVQVSEEFCRTFISNTLATLVYLQVHIPKYANLISTFMGTCDSKGRYLKKSMPKGAVKLIDSTTEKIITSCFKGRNTPTWLTSCQSICQKWTPGKLNPYFAPDSEQMNAAVRHIIDNMKNFEEEEEEGDSRRVLSEKHKKSPKKLNKNRKLQKGGAATAAPASTAASTATPAAGASAGTSTTKSGNSTAPAGGKSAVPSAAAATAKALKNTSPQDFDAQGMPINYRNFTKNGTDVGSLMYLTTKEMNVTTERHGLPINLNSPVVYQSQNTTIAPTFGDWVVEVNDKGADFYLASQYSRINLEAIEGLYQPDEKAPKLKKVRKARKLASASLLSGLAASLLVLLGRF